jgi:SAM-dependent methyltransferase
VWHSATPPPWESESEFHGLREIITDKRIPPGSKCIEFGPGSSASSLYMALEGFKVDAVDVCPLAIERAKQRPNAELVNWIQADLLSPDLFSTKLAPGSYDLVFDMQCFHCLREINEALAAEVIYTALKPQGYAMVVVGAADPSYDDIVEDPLPGPPMLWLHELRKPLEAAGLTTVQLSLSRLSPTPQYDVPVPRNPLGLPPLAWVGLFQKVVWDPDAVYALEVQAPFSTYILEGKKTIETRAYPLPAALLNKRVLLLEPAEGIAAASSLPAQIAAGSAKCKVIGSVTFNKCTRYETAEAWETDRDKHLVPKGSAYDWKEDVFMKEHNDTREFPTLEDGKVQELYAWHVVLDDSASVSTYKEVPAMQRVYRSLFKVL